MLSPKLYLQGIDPKKTNRLSPVKKNFMTSRNPHGQSLWYHEKDQIQ